MPFWILHNDAGAAPNTHRQTVQSLLAASACANSHHPDLRIFDIRHWFNHRRGAVKHSVYRRARG